MVIARGVINARRPSSSHVTRRTGSSGIASSSTSPARRLGQSHHLSGSVDKGPLQIGRIIFGHRALPSVRIFQIKIPQTNQRKKKKFPPKKRRNPQ
jgi:hypothetical protein